MGFVAQKQEEVLKYLRDHQITEKLNVVVNALAKKKPDNPYAYLAAELAKEQEVKILSVRARQIFDSRGSEDLVMPVQFHKLKTIL